MESSVQFICVFCGSLSDEYGCPCSTCELCGNDAHYGYDCPSQVPFVYNQDPCFNQNLDNFPQTSPSFPQQYLCCEDCECYLPFRDNSPYFNNDSEIFSNPLFDSNADYTSSDDESSSEEDVPVENFKIYSNPLLEFDEEIFSSEINLLYNEEFDTFLFQKDSIPPELEKRFWTRGDIVFLDNLLNDDPIPEYEHFTFDIEPDAPVINNSDELNEDECFNPGGGEIDVSQELKMTILLHLSFEFFYRILPTMWILLYFSPPGVKIPFLTLTSPLRAGGISSGWNFHVL
ncbi:hypothetical protein Tco_0431322 [Tanacetum coccineum]